MECPPGIDTKQTLGKILQRHFVHGSAHLESPFYPIPCQERRWDRNEGPFSSTHIRAEPSSGPTGGLSRSGLGQDTRHSFRQATTSSSPPLLSSKGGSQVNASCSCWLTSRAQLERQNWIIRDASELAIEPDAGGSPGKISELVLWRITAAISQMGSNKQINNLQTNCSSDKFLLLQCPGTAWGSQVGKFLLPQIQAGVSLLCEEQICKSRGRKGNGSGSTASGQRSSCSPRGVK